MRWLCVIILVSLVLFLVNYLDGDFLREGLVSRPDNGEKTQISNQIIANANLFSRPYSEIAGRFPWMDIVLYEDVRGLIRANRLNPQELEKIM
jgi:hypothetical protein